MNYRCDHGMPTAVTLRFKTGPRAGSRATVQTGPACLGLWAAGWRTSGLWTSVDRTGQNGRQDQMNMDIVIDVSSRMGKGHQTDQNNDGRAFGEQTARPER